MQSATRIIAFLFAVVLILGIAAEVSAQSYILEPIPDNTYKVGMRYIRPSFEYDIMEISTFSGTYDFFGAIPIGESFTVRFSLPFSRANYPEIVLTDEYGNEIGKGVSNHQFGNISIGGQYRQTNASGLSTILSLNVFLPTAQSNAYFAPSLAIDANPYEFERVIPDLLTLRGNFAARYEKLNPENFGFYVGGDIGPMIWVPTGDLTGETELLFRYGICGGGRFSNVTFGAEIYGLYLLTEDVGSAAEQFDNFALLGVSLIDYPVRPSFFVTFPLDDEFSEYIDFMYGFRLEAAIPKT
jgi:hypothetical protein